MSGIKITGLDALQRSLENLQRRTENLSGPVAFEDLFPPEFMRRYTDFKTIDDMFGGFNPPIESKEDFERVPDADWDVYVQARTKFKSWDDMQGKAGEEYAIRRLNIDNL